MRVVFVSIAVLILFFLFIRFIEQRSLYFPLRGIDATPREIGLDYEEIFVMTQDGVRIAGWFVPAESPRATLLLSHGNGGNISHRLDKIRMLHSLRLNVLVYDYRGYGMSRGKPSEDGLYLDADAVYSYLVDEKKIPPRSIVGYGESLGGAVTIDLAAKQEMGGIIIEGSFSSVRDMAKRIFPFVPGFVYKTTFNSFEKIKNMKLPKLHFHSMSDEVVPFEIGRKLFDNAPEPKEFVKLQGGHNDSFIISNDLYLSSIDAFIKTKITP